MMSNPKAPPRLAEFGTNGVTFCLERARVKVTLQGPPADPLTLTFPVPIVGSASKAAFTSAPVAL